MPALPPGTVVATGPDGSGAQGFMVTLKRGRKQALATLVLKHGHGVREATLLDGLSKREAGEIDGQMAQMMDRFAITPETLRLAIAHGLAVGLRHDEMPPFDLVAVFEALALPPIAPERLPPEAVIERVLDGAPPASRSRKAVEAALAASARWAKRYQFFDAWFDTDEGVREALRAPGTGPEETVLARALEPRRGHWGELLAWAALVARDTPGSRDAVPFALVAREMLGDRPLTAIPLALQIAALSGSVAAGMEGAFDEDLEDDDPF